MFQTTLKATLMLLLTLAATAPAVPANAMLLPATAAVQAAPDFAVTVAPDVETRKRGTGAIFNLTIQSLNGFSGTIDVTVSGAPPATTGDGTFALSIGAGQTSTFNFVFQTHKVTTPIGTFPITFSATGGGVTHTVTATLVTR